MGKWTKLAGPATAAPTANLSDGFGFGVEFNLSEPSSCSFSISGRSVQSYSISELGTDVHLLFNGAPLFPGRVTSTVDSLTQDGHERKVNVIDTRGLLNRRLTAISRSYLNADVSDFVTDVLSDAQGTGSASLGVAAPQFALTGVALSRQSSAGQPISKELQDAAGGSDGASLASPLFDWDVTPGWLGRKFQLWTRRGSDKGVFLDYTWSDRNPRSSNVASLTRTFDPSTYANQVFITGGVKKVKSGQTVQSETQPNPVEVVAKPGVGQSSTGLVQRGVRGVSGSSLGATATERSTSTEKARLQALSAAAAGAAGKLRADADGLRFQATQVDIRAADADIQGRSAVASGLRQQSADLRTKANSLVQQASGKDSEAAALKAQADAIKAPAPVVSRAARNATPTAPNAPVTSVEDSPDFDVPTTPVAQFDGSLAWSVGVWATAEGYTDILDQNELQAKAASRLQELQQVTPSYQIVLMNGFWRGPDHIWLGDTVTVRVDDGCLYEQVSLRVTSIKIDVGDDGGETVSLTVGSPAPQLLNALVDNGRRIASLERRR